LISLRSAELHRIRLKTRIPFRYGIATMTDVTHVFLRIRFEIDGKAQTGLAADHLPPKWFTKDPDRPLDEEVDEMLAVIRAAVANARTIRAAMPFEFWRELHAVQGGWGTARRLPPLLAHFGTSLVERALIDAFCRAKGATFAEALRSNGLGIDLGAVHGELAGSSPSDWLPESLPAEVLARHTVGLSDPLTEEDIPSVERVGDGLPQSLGACIRAYGLRHFKVKINGDATRDRARVAGVAAILARECRDGFAFSLDGNESFSEVAAFSDSFRDLRAAAGDDAFWSRLLFIEQPWHRDVALSPAIGELARTWPDRPPIVIDESDEEPGSLPAALALGYAGTSHKNCKGVFKSVASACLLAQRRAAGLPAILSGEDLSNIGPVALMQDLAVAACLGVTSIERNGHHYFAGLSQFPWSIQAHVLAHHGDLYTRATAGWPRLDVRDGRVRLGSVLAAPFGHAGDLDLSALASERLA
jgi:hypothetical protein